VIFVSFVVFVAAAVARFSLPNERAGDPV